MKRRPLFILALGTLAAVAGGLSACASFSGLGGGNLPPMPLASAVDMNRIYGGWHIIATIPNSFEKGVVAPYDVYSKRPDGDIREDFYARWGGFDAKLHHYTVHDWVKSGTGNAHWRVQLLWPINLPFLILYVDPDYRYVLFGEQNRKLGWIYSRTATMPDGDYQDMLARAQSLGYDKTLFRKFVQTPAQIDQAGFWSDGIRQARLIDQKTP